MKGGDKMDRTIVLKHRKVSREYWWYFLLFFILVLTVVIVYPILDFNMFVHFILFMLLLILFLVIYMERFTEKYLHTIELKEKYMYIRTVLFLKNKRQVIYEDKIYYANIKYIKEERKINWGYKAMKLESIVHHSHGLMSGGFFNTGGTFSDEIESHIERSDKEYIYIYNQQHQPLNKIEIMELVGPKYFRYFINFLLTENPSIQTSNYINRLMQ